MYIWFLSFNYEKMINENILPRLKQNLQKEDFLELTKLHRKHNWLYNSTEGLYNIWEFCENNIQKNLIKLLLDNFTYSTSQNLLDNGDIIAKHIEDIWKLIPENTFLLASSDGKDPDGSQAFIQSLKNKFSYQWKSRNFFNNILDGAHQIVNNKSNIILVDDFIGTGETIESKYNYLVKTLTKRGIKDFSIKIISYAAMEAAKERISLLPNVDFFSSIWLKKGISDLVGINETEKNIFNQSMTELELKLYKKYNNLTLSRFNFGYKRSEALYCLEAYNIPNNVFPIFWWPKLIDKSIHKTMFNRK